MSPKQERSVTTSGFSINAERWVGTSTLKVGPLSIRLLLPPGQPLKCQIGVWSHLANGCQEDGKNTTKRGKKLQKMTRHSVWRSAISECLSLRISVKKNVSRLLQQFPGRKTAEEPSSLGSIVSRISEMVLNCLNGSAYDVQCSWTYSRKSWVIQIHRDYDGNIGFISE